ncbi:MAG: hypothetical protein ABIT38_22275 [Gemmatimonadaceae bacterium]
MIRRLYMLYWTNTGLFERINKRYISTRKALNISKKRATRGKALGEVINAHIPLPSSKPLAAAQQWRSFLLNIVMIDFADAPRRQEIRDFTVMSASHLAGVE